MTDDKSAAARFIEEHELIQREKTLVSEERDSFKELAFEAQNLNKLQTAEIASLREQIRSEAARANMWLAHTMKLAGQLEAIGAVISDSRRIAADAARAVAVQGMDEEMTVTDAEALQRIAGTTVPTNHLS